jgi:fructose-1,6-bisphosphatase-3
MQFKAEGRLIERHPEWNLSGRRLLHRIRFENGKAVSVEVDGVQHAMLDDFLPTIDPNDPYAYSAEEQACVDRLKESCTRSMRLREHMEWLVKRGGMWTRRDEVLMYHACVPVDAKGKPQELVVDGVARSGRELMDALASVVRRVMRRRWFALDDDADWIWYLWCGPCSPLFGKDKITTFESSFIADKATHKEHKNPYFELMHDAAFVRSIGKQFGCGDDVLIVNGHVPVKIEKGEQPLKQGGNAITIDGAFSEAYGDRGYTLVLRPEGVDLAQHAPFAGVDSALEDGADIVPHMTQIRTHAAPRTIASTQDGERIRRKIADLEDLVKAYQEGVLRET